MENVSTTINFYNLRFSNYRDVTLELAMKGPGFEFKADLAFDNEVPVPPFSG